MNVISGRIDEIYIEEGVTMARVHVGSAYTRVPLMFLMEGKVGDTILMESGVAISKVENESTKKGERRRAYVPSDSR